MRLLIGLMSMFCLSGCSSMLYYPSKTKYFDPESQTIDVHPRDVWFNSEDGTRLHGWYFKSSVRKEAKALLIFFHGNAENLTTHFATLLWLLPHGYDFFIFDYRGYGESEGKPSPQGTVEDGVAALRKGHELSPQLPLVVFAQSLGAAVALKSTLLLKKELTPKLVTVDSGFASYEDAGAAVLSHSWITWLFQPFAYLLLSDQWAPKQELSELSPIPLLVMHGTRDQVIDYRLGEKVFKSANEPKEFWKIEGGFHTDGFWRDREGLRKRYVEKLDSIVGK